MWFSFLVAFGVVISLALLVSFVIHRTLSGDIANYNRRPRYESFMTDLDGWKALHGDVFRTPKHPMVLSVLVGVGSQLVGMTIFSLCNEKYQHQHPCVFIYI